MRTPFAAAVIAAALALGAAAAVPSRAGEAGTAAREKHDELRARIQQGRAAFLERWKRERAPEERRALRGEARAFVITAIADEIVPAWLGQPWTMAVIDDGLRPDAEYPGQPGRGVSCSWFVVRVLQDAGLRFAGPSRFAGTISVHFARSMVARPGQVQRHFHVSPVVLERRLAAGGDGLYVVGLNCHIGFIHVRDGRARFMHSSYVDPLRVVIEPLAESPAIGYSQDAGYVIAPLFHDAYLVDRWITGTAVPFVGPIPGR